jgi:hypothetical protein
MVRSFIVAPLPVPASKTWWALSVITVGVRCARVRPRKRVAALNADASLYAVGAVVDAGGGPRRMIIDDIGQALGRLNVLAHTTCRVLRVSREQS